MNNYSGVKLRNDIINILNNSGVEVVVGYFVVKDILHTLEDLLEEAIKQEQNEPQVQEKSFVQDIAFDINEEKEIINNEQSDNPNASEYSGSVNDN